MEKNQLCDTALRYMTNKLWREKEIENIEIPSGMQTHFLFIMTSELFHCASILNPEIKK